MSSTRWSGAVLALLLGCAACVQAPERGLTVAAASSLAPVLPALADSLRAESGLETTVVLGASVDLAEQIRSGAPIGLFLSADPALVDSLEAEGLLAGQPVEIGLGTLSLVLSAETQSVGPPSVSILTHPAIQRLVIADPRHAPFGAAARQALEAAGLWETIEEKVVFAGSALQALEVVRTGNAQAGIVPTSLLAGSDMSSSLIPLDLYTPPQFAAGRIRGTWEEEASLFLEVLLSDEGRAILEASGMLPVDGS